jgi:dimethylargininase
MLIAITRPVSSSITRCELTHLLREPINLELARKQHSDYESALESIGCQIHRLQELPDCPDSVFVADPCFVFDEIAIITRPGAESRRLETDSVSKAMKTFRELRFIEAPGTLDGGDVLCLGKEVFVGLSRRTNESGLDQIQKFLNPFGYSVTGIHLMDCLHLQTAVTQVGQDTLLVNRTWIDPSIFRDWKIIDVHSSEPFAANALMIGDFVLFPATFRETQKRLETNGIRIVSVDVSELAKAEAGVTCCSLIIPI